ncbi:hypothetical protein HETIRDRAFT_429216 [Heterobasidion irregulare TC 32-1]|uniref:Uncharacterized protein n=1 Tax=Heterobasidion irregulare (strain TC 32-1) TaxID=747525 RepID=W4JX43_HETIT|nr:uncharacterized protein HETIRDRAFT_429216 [Heterobasidion irregulare TC 32-1]ETW78132.1 hypothetical protein HETIRDRAFT_429216 [Heterobasidion irregulare TC 32-1]
MDPEERTDGRSLQAVAAMRKPAACVSMMPHTHMCTLHSPASPCFADPPYCQQHTTCVLHPTDHPTVYHAHNAYDTAPRTAQTMPYHAQRRTVFTASASHGSAGSGEFDFVPNVKFCKGYRGRTQFASLRVSFRLHRARRGRLGVAMLARSLKIRKKKKKGAEGTAKEGSRKAFSRTVPTARGDERGSIHRYRHVPARDRKERGICKTGTHRHEGTDGSRFTYTKRAFDIAQFPGVRRLLGWNLIEPPPRASQLGIGKRQRAPNRIEQKRGEAHSPPTRRGKVWEPLGPPSIRPHRTAPHRIASFDCVEHHCEKPRTLQPDGRDAGRGGSGSHGTACAGSDSSFVKSFFFSFEPRRGARWFGDQLGSKADEGSGDACGQMNVGAGSEGGGAGDRMDHGRTAGGFQSPLDRDAPVVARATDRRLRGLTVLGREMRRAVEACGGSTGGVAPGADVAAGEPAGCGGGGQHGKSGRRMRRGGGRRRKARARAGSIGAGRARELHDVHSGSAFVTGVDAENARVPETSREGGGDSGGLLGDYWGPQEAVPRPWPRSSSPAGEPVQRLARGDGAYVQGVSDLLRRVERSGLRGLIEREVSDRVIALWRRAWWIGWRRES